MRRLHTTTATLILIGLSVFTQLQAEIKEVVLLHTNDIESVYDPLPAVWRDDIEWIGGIPHLATLIHQVRANEATSFLLDAGDIFTGALSKKTQGKLPFDLYSAMGYDVLTLGNHEFEYGWETLLEQLPRASFPVLNANIVHRESGTRIAQPYTILERDGIRIGVVGVMGLDAFHNTTAKFHRAELTILDPVATAQFWVDKIRDDVDVVVVLTHQNKTAPMQTNKEADPTVQRGFDEDYAMAGALTGVDVIFGGHSDNGLPQPVVHPDTGTVIGLTFGQGMHLGYTRFAVDTDLRSVEFLGGKLIPVDADELPPDPRTSQLITEARAAHPMLSEHAATLDATAMRRYNRESTIGNLLTDVMRVAGDSDIAMLNSGAIRADLRAGTVTREHLINVYPFVDSLTVVELTGAQIREFVSYSLTLPYGIAQFSGLEIVYDGSREANQRLIAVSHNGEPLNHSQRYSVATSAFVANGGDGYGMFSDGTVVADELDMATLFFDSFKAQREIALPALGRQVDVSDSEE
ncbi:MAG: bifunctional UDP-sugar hydrolase/5'-nucleotidase [Pseudomonadota bacterium]